MLALRCSTVASCSGNELCSVCQHVNAATHGLLVIGRISVADKVLEVPAQCGVENKLSARLVVADRGAHTVALLHGGGGVVGRVVVRGRGMAEEKKED